MATFEWKRVKVSSMQSESDSADAASVTKSTIANLDPLTLDSFRFHQIALSNGTVLPIVHVEDKWTT